MLPILDVEDSRDGTPVVRGGTHEDFGYVAWYSRRIIPGSWNDSNIRPAGRDVRVRPLRSRTDDKAIDATALPRKLHVWTGRSDQTKGRLIWGIYERHPSRGDGLDAIREAQRSDDTCDCNHSETERGQPGKGEHHSRDFSRRSGIGLEDSGP